jgi:hypothetical protein
MPLMALLPYDEVMGRNIKGKLIVVLGLNKDPKRSDVCSGEPVARFNDEVGMRKVAESHAMTPIP